MRQSRGKEATMRRAAVRQKRASWQEAGFSKVTAVALAL